MVAFVLALNMAFAATGTLRSEKLPLVLNRWYSVAHTVKLRILSKANGERNYNVPEQLKRLKLARGTELSVLKYSKDRQYALLGIDEDISAKNPGIMSGEPVIVWVRTVELTHGSLRYVDEEIFATLAELGLGATPIVRKNIISHCLRDVHITSTRLSRNYVPRAEMASQALPAYQAAGWTLTEYSPTNPIGTACFFSGGRPCGKKTYCGHAAIKVSQHRWKGAGLWPTPFLRNRRDNGRIPYRLQGCVVPAGEQRLCDAN